MNDGILYNGSCGTYYVDGLLCTCPSFCFRGKCKHQQLMARIEMIKDSEIATTIHAYPSSIEAFNRYFGDFWTSDGISCFYAMPKTGKTLLGVQEAYYLASTGLNVLIIDSEGGTGSFIEKWKPVFEKRFGHKGQVYFEQQRTFEGFYDYLGFKASMFFRQKKQKGDKKSLEGDWVQLKDEDLEAIQKSSGQLLFNAIQTEPVSRLARDVENGHIDVVICDSITAQTKLSFTNAEQNFPSRSSAMATALKGLINVQDRFHIPILATAHAAQPIEFRASTTTDVYGGQIITHFCKRVIYLDKKGGEENKKLRRAWIWRNENIDEYDAMIPLRYGDDGVTEAKDIDVKNLLTDGEIKKGLAEVIR